VHEPSQAYDAALATYVAARAEYRQAEEAVKQAERQDARAAESALDAGETIPQPTTDRARTALEAAQRKVGAAAEVAHQRQNVFLSAVAAVHAEIATALDAELGKGQSQVEQHLNAITEAIIERREAERFREALGDGEDLRGRHPYFQPAMSPKQRQRLPTAVTSALEAVRAAAQ
jgi:hypothetical protein